ncbi:STAS domain-containing protein [Novosphingobium sp.]|jgi:hypothetical protein|uniref:STAS domain-containing protein n=1 Tax=Novosphingobium sp. TaxID=1874826 RepID=UPI0028A5EBD0|nr:STAS domain-containing protein [Novosphingobium sp.]
MIKLAGKNPEDKMRQVIAVTDSVTVRSAREFASVLSSEFEAGRDNDLDLSALKDVDLAFIEIVYSARAQWAMAGRELRLTHPVQGAVLPLLERAGFLTDITPRDLEFWFHGELPQ